MITKHSLFKEIIDFTEFVLIFLGIFFITGSFIQDTTIKSLIVAITTITYYFFIRKKD